MIRIVFVGWKDNDWRLYRQPQWMAQVRETPEAATDERLHFDIDENAFKAALAEWNQAGGRSSRESAIEAIRRHGAVEVRRT